MYLEKNYWTVLFSLFFFFNLQLDSEIIEFKTQYPPRYLRIWLGREDIISKLSQSVIFLWLSKF